MKTQWNSLWLVIGMVVIGCGGDDEAAETAVNAEERKPQPASGSRSRGQKLQPREQKHSRGLRNRVHE